MRTILNALLEESRIRGDDLYGTETGDLHGAFVIVGITGRALKILSSGTGKGREGWEHVSVSCEDRTPSWAEMCMVKDLFWRDDEVVMQLHPAKSDYVDHHPYCLHLWKPIRGTIPTPPSHLVGPKGETS